MLEILLILYLCRPRYTARARGSTRVRCRCDTCDAVFEYRMRRTATHTVSGAILSSVTDYDRDRAEDAAEDRLDDLLDTDFDCVPCPACGDYQPEMADRLREKKYGWVRRLSWWPLAVGGLAGLFAAMVGLIALGEADRGANDQTPMMVAGVSGFVAVALLAVGIGLRLSCPRMMAAYNPNDLDGTDDRIDEAREVARLVRPGRTPDRTRNLGPDW